MRKKAISSLTAPAQPLPAPMGQETAQLKEEAELAALDLAALNQPPKNDPAKLQKHRENVQRKVAAYRERLLRKFAAKMPADSRPLTLTVEEFIKDRIRFENPDISVETLAKPLRELIPFLKTFDWRSQKITPFVRDQRPCASCWSFVATEAFECSLMIQRANFAKFARRRGVFEVEHLSLSVMSTLDCVQPGNCNGGRVETAFNHFFKFGASPRGFNLFPRNEEQDPDFKLDLGDCMQKGKTGIKAVGWDYVHLPPHEIPSVRKLKEALLEHGPLATMVTADGAFAAYGQPGTPLVFETDNQDAPNHVVLLIGWDDEKSAWVIQNTRGTQWGQQCDGPKVMAFDFRSEDRGFMYIRWGSNHIGQYAAWVEAPLLTEGWQKKIRALKTK